MTALHQRRILSPQAPIGIFDSGVGGLTVTREIMQMLPHERLIYVGDTARCPYGPKDRADIKDFALQIGRYLVGQGVKLIVIACNTATAHGLAALQSQLPVACIGVIEPGARAAALATISGRVGVIGTQGTINSGLYAKHLLQLDRGLQIVSQATPAFVEIVERSFLLEPEDAASQVARDFDRVAPAYLDPILRHQADVLVLGCTHFPLLASNLARACGPSIRLISSARQTAEQVRWLLSAKNLLVSPPGCLDIQNDGQKAHLEEGRLSSGGTALAEEIGPSSEGTALVQEVHFSGGQRLYRDAADLAENKPSADQIPMQHTQVTCLTTAPDTRAFERAGERILGKASYQVTHLPLEALAFPDHA